MKDIFKRFDEDTNRDQIETMTTKSKAAREMDQIDRTASQRDLIDTKARLIRQA